MITDPSIKALKQYNAVAIQSGIEDASPHRLIQMLMDGALLRVSKARASMKTGNMAEKGEFISSAISIIGGLRDSLDHTNGAEVAKNLDALYEYMSHRLITGNAENDDQAFAEVHGLLLEIKLAWDEIAQTESQSATDWPGPTLQQAAG